MTSKSEEILPLIGEAEDTPDLPEGRGRARVLLACGLLGSLAFAAASFHTYRGAAASSASLEYIPHGVGNSPDSSCVASDSAYLYKYTIASYKASEDAHWVTDMLGACE